MAVVGWIRKAVNVTVSSGGRGAVWKCEAGLVVLRSGGRGLSWHGHIGSGKAVEVCRGEVGQCVACLGGRG